VVANGAERAKFSDRLEDILRCWGIDVVERKFLGVTGDVPPLMLIVYGRLQMPAHADTLHPVCSAIVQQ
jgi:hypothetical protein